MRRKSWLLSAIFIAAWQLCKGDHYFEQEFQKCHEACPHYNDAKFVSAVSDCVRVSPVQADERHVNFRYPKDLDGLKGLHYSLASLPSATTNCKVFYRLTEEVLKNATTENSKKNEYLRDLTVEKDKVRHYDNASRVWQDSAQICQGVLEGMITNLISVFQREDLNEKLTSDKKADLLTTEAKTMMYRFGNCTNDLEVEAGAKSVCEVAMHRMNGSLNELIPAHNQAIQQGEMKDRKIEDLEKQLSNTTTLLEKTTQELEDERRASNRTTIEIEKLRSIIDNQRRVLGDRERVLDTCLQDKEQEQDARANCSTLLSLERSGVLNKTQELNLAQVNLNSTLVEKEDAVAERDQCQTDLAQEQQVHNDTRSRMENDKQEFDAKFTTQDESLKTMNDSLTKCIGSKQNLTEHANSWIAKANNASELLDKALEKIANLTTILVEKESEEDRLNNRIMELKANVSTSTGKANNLGQTLALRDTLVGQLKSNISDGLEDFNVTLANVTSTNNNLETQLAQVNSTLQRGTRSLVMCKQKRKRLSEENEELREYEELFELANDQLDAEILDRTAQGISDRAIWNGTGFAYLKLNPWVLGIWIGSMLCCLLIGGLFVFTLTLVRKPKLITNTGIPIRLL